MPPHDRAKARLEHEVTILRREVARLRSKQEQRRKAEVEQAVLQARLEQEIHSLEYELTEFRNKRQERQCGGAEQSTKLNQHLKKLDGHVVKQERYITFLEDQINHTRNKYKERMTDVHQGADEAKEKLQKMQTEMQTIKEKAAAVDQLQRLLTCLNNKLERRNNVIAIYQAQHEDFVRVIGDLQKQVERQAGGGVGDSNSKYASNVDITTAKPPSVPKSSGVGKESKSKSNHGSKMKTKETRDVTPEPTSSKPSAFNFLREALQAKLKTDAH